MYFIISFITGFMRHLVSNRPSVMEDVNHIESTFFGGFRHKFRSANLILHKRNKNRKATMRSAKREWPND